MLLQTLERPKLTMLLGLMLRIVEYMESWIHDHDDFQFLSHGSNFFIFVEAQGLDKVL